MNSERSEITRALKLMDEYNIPRQVLLEKDVWPLASLRQYAGIGQVRAIIIRKIQRGQIALV